MQVRPHRPFPFDIDSDTEELLLSSGFEVETFESLRQRLREGGRAEDFNLVSGELALPERDSIPALPAPDSAEYERLAALGRQAIARGEVACLVLAGGMATRFGGVVKANVEVLPGATFLDLKLQAIAREAAQAGGNIPVYLMTSFATHAEIAEAIEGRPQPGTQPRLFMQNLSLRLSPEGELFRLQDGKVSPYAPGHGDVPSAFQRSGLLEEFRKAGGRLVYISNVDNLGATVEPAVIGMHLESGRPLSVEVTERYPDDRGGAPALLEGRAQVIEAFRFPPDFDYMSIPVFNTNTLLIDAAALAQHYALDWFYVRKEVQGRPAIQFERLVGQLSAFLHTLFVEVPREGERSRFLPVKDREELAQRRAQIAALFAREQGSLP